jgi:hypothetical protein
VNIETSTVNMLLAAILALQCWLVREVFNLKEKVNLIWRHCKRCPQNLEEQEHD